MNPKTIKCPVCKKRMGRYDGKSKISPIISDCHECRIRVLYYVETGELRKQALPTRTTSSGMTFR